MLACALIASCSSFEKICFSERADMTKLSRSEQAVKVNFDYKTPRYVAFIGRSSASSRINDHAARLILEGKFPQAEALLKNVLADDPKCPQACNNLGIVYESSGNYAKAFEFYSRAALIDPDEEYYQINIRGTDYGK
jgi:tetratricopeptide (TPR) repeat protein